MFKKLSLAAIVSMTSVLLTQASAFAAPCAGTMDVTTRVKVDRQWTTVVTPTAYDLGKKVSTASSCLIAEATNDSVSNPAALTVNTEAFFGMTDWIFDAKFETGSTPTLASFSPTGSGGFLSGTFTLTAEALKYDNIMFVLKSGSDNGLVAYLLDLNFSGGKVNTPFLNPPFSLNGDSAAKGISHISVYYNGAEGEGESNDVPEPGSMALFGLGALGFVALRRKQASRK